MMEDLLTPQICMDVDETPIIVGNENPSDEETSETSENEVDEDEKVKMLLEAEFNDPSQAPDELTDFEKEAKKNVFAIGEPSVQFQRHHCTACNVHLGSAPIGHFNRYIHPLLKVLLCKVCYEFYCSGEFDKDEDGSEMYCRWCGQGGKVMCCAQCAYVFCQKCVRQNLGRKVLELIKDSDDWMCFGCNPTQLINLKIICTTLFDFVQEEIRLSKALNNAERLKVDHSVCCQKIKALAAKRKREDLPYNPATEWDEQIKSAKKPATTNSILKQTLTQPPIIDQQPMVTAAQPKTWDLQCDEDEVVCTPDLPSLIDEDDPTKTAQSPVHTYRQQQSQSNSSVHFTILNNNKTENRFVGGNVVGKLPCPPLIRPVGNKKIYSIGPKSQITKSPILICASNTRPVLSNNVQHTIKPNSNFIRLQTPAIKFITPPNRTNMAPIVNASPAQIVPGLKHEWFEKAATIVSTITGNLSTTLVFLTKEQKSAKTVEQLATVHNKLQELLSTSVNSLIQVRKNLRNEFLGDLNKLKFTDNPYLYNNSNKSAPEKTVQANSNVNNSLKKINVDEDDDVVIVNPETSKKPEKISAPDAATIKRPYLKVRSVSQLLSVPSECITIPDDPPGEPDDVVEIREEDPLCLSPPHNETTETKVKLIMKDEKAAEADESEIPTDPTKSTKDVLSAVPNMADYDEETYLNIKNALAESKIDLLVEENMKFIVEDVAPEDLKKVLSVRVLIATNYRSDLPKNRLKTADWFTDDIEAVLGGNILIRNLGFIPPEGDVQENDIRQHSSEEPSDISKENKRLGEQEPISSLCDKNETNKLEDATVKTKDIENENETNCEKNTLDDELHKELNDENKESLGPSQKNDSKNTEKVLESNDNTLHVLDDNIMASLQCSITNENRSPSTSKESAIDELQYSKNGDKMDAENSVDFLPVATVFGDENEDNAETDLDNLLKGDEFSTDPITTDSGIEVDGK